MGTYLDKFPKTLYDINRAKLSNYVSVTNIFFRIQLIKETINNTAAYYVYSIKDTETPEILAENVYKNPQAHWMILYANDMIDAQYDWPLNYKNFQNYIINKYGSIAIAQTTVHHHEKVISRTINSSTEVSEIKQEIDYINQTDTVPSYYHYDYYTGMAETEYNTYNVNGDTIHETISKREIYCYDYENELNENKRIIKIIKPEYYLNILSELNILLNENQLPFYRKLA